MNSYLERNLGFLSHPNYFVDTDGNVFSNKNGEIKQLIPYDNGYGYLYVCLSENNKHYKYRVQKLIALAFIPNPENKPCIDHINGNRTDNRVCNLRWSTQKENINNGITLKRMSESQKGRISSQRKTVYKYSKENVLLGVYSSTYDASEKCNICQSTINACCNGRRKTAGGFKWSYKKEDD